VDIVVTEIGAAVNPRRPDLLAALRDAPVPLMTIEELKDRAYALVGTPDPIPFTDRVVALVEYRDGTIIDVIHQIAEI